MSVDRTTTYKKTWAWALVFLGLASLTRAQEIIFQDDFADGDAAGWTFIVSSSWAVQPHNGSLALHLATASATGDEYALIQNRLFDNFTLEVDLQIVPAAYTNCFIYFNYNGYGNNYYLQLLNSGIRLYRTVDNIQPGTIIASASGNFADPAKSYHLTLTRDFPQIRVAVDGTEILRVADATFRSGQIGVGSYLGTCWVDNVVIKAPPTGFVTDFTDDFESGAATGWQPLHPARWQVSAESSNHAYCITTSNYFSPNEQRVGEYSLIANRVYTDFALTCRFWLGPLDASNENADAALIFGFQDSLNYYFVDLNRADAGFTSIRKVVAGNATYLASHAQGVVLGGQAYTVKLLRTGARIEVYFDNVLILSATDNTFITGRVGIGSYDDAPCFDDVQVAIPAPTESPYTYADDFESGNADNWLPKTPERWQVIRDGGDTAYFLRDTNYWEDATGVGEYAVFTGYTFTDFTFACKARSAENFVENENADFVILFGFQDASNFYSVGFNHATQFCLLGRVVNGQRTTIATSLLDASLVPDNTYHEIEIQRRGESIEVYWDRQRVFGVADLTFPHGKIALASANDRAFFDDVFISNVLQTPPRAEVKYILPQGLQGLNNGKISFPIVVSSYAALTGMQFVIEYKSQIVQFVSATISPTLPGFTLPQIDPSPGFAPSTPGLDANLLLEVQRTGSSVFFGGPTEIIVLTFQLSGSPGASTPIVFDQGESRTFAIANNLQIWRGAAINLNDGDMLVQTSGQQIAGNITYFSRKKPLPNVTLNLQSSTSHLLTTSDANGEFQFNGLPQNKWTLSPVYKATAPDIVLTADVSLLLRYLGFAENLGALQVQAADVNADGRVSGADALAILRYLAGFTTYTGLVESWGFAPAAVIIESPGVNTTNFTAYVRGDLDGSWDEPVIGKTGASADTGITVAIVWQKEQQQALLRVTAAQPVFGVRLVIHYEKSRWRPGNLEAGTGFLFAANTEIDGAIHLAAAAPVVSAPDAVLFEVPFTAITEDAVSSVFKLAKVMVNDHRRPDMVTAVEDSPPAIPTHFALLQNRPNPFRVGAGTGQTAIDLLVPAGAQGEQRLEIYDLRGRRLRTLSRGPLTPGPHRVWWDGTDASGQPVPASVYFYVWRTETYTARKKMVLIR